MSKNTQKLMTSSWCRQVVTCFGKDRFFGGAAALAFFETAALHRCRKTCGWLKWGALRLPEHHASAAALVWCAKEAESRRARCAALCACVLLCALRFGDAVCILKHTLLTTHTHHRQQVKSIAEMGAYVSLLEYNGIEGMILLSELSRRRIRSITKLIKVGRQEPVMVLRVDKEKGYIDLSKRCVLLLLQLLLLLLRAAVVCCVIAVRLLLCCVPVHEATLWPQQLRDGFADHP
jgi:hypothetical protein